jgi:hypothetical protein
MINPDDLKMQLPEAQAAFLRLAMQDEIGTGGVRLAARDKDWAAQVHEESSLLAKILTRRAMDRGLDIVVDGTGDDTLEKMIKKVKAAKAKGYTTVGTYINADPEVGIGGAIGRQEETHRSVGLKIQIPTFINLARMLTPTGKKDIDGKPDSLLSGVFDEFVLYDREIKRNKDGSFIPPYIVGHSSAGGDFILNSKNQERTEKVITKLQQYLPNLSTKNPKDPMSYDSIYGRFEEDGKRIGRQEKRRVLADKLLERAMSEEKRLKYYEEKGKLLKANVLRSKIAVEKIALRLGMPISQVLADGRVAPMLNSGASIQDIVDYFQNRGSN